MDRYDTPRLRFAKQFYPNVRKMFLYGVVFVPDTFLLSDMFVVAGFATSRRDYRQQQHNFDVFPLREGVLFLTKNKKRHLVSGRVCILLDEKEYEQRPL